MIIEVLTSFYRPVYLRSFYETYIQCFVHLPYFFILDLELRLKYFLIFLINILKFDFL